MSSRSTARLAQRQSGPDDGAIDGVIRQGRHPPNDPPRQNESVPHPVESKARSLLLDLDANAFCRRADKRRIEGDAVTASLGQCALAVIDLCLVLLTGHGSLDGPGHLVGQLVLPVPLSISTRIPMGSLTTGAR